MRLIFCGTPHFAVPSLERLVDEGFKVPLVVTQPDRPRGRGMELVASPVKKSAVRRGIKVIQPEKIKTNEDFRREIEELRPEAIIVVGYGRIIPQWMIELPKHGNINLHASLLPKYRGAAPIQWAIANGETVSGSTTMRIDAGLDTGDILMQQELPILPDDTAVTYAPRLAAAGATLLATTLRGLDAGTIAPQPQSNVRATFAPILKKEDGRVDFQRTATDIVNRLRGFQPWPGAFTAFRGKTLNLYAANGAVGYSIPMAMLTYTDGKLLAGCGHGTTLEIFELQPEGKKRMSARDFANGNRLAALEPLGR
ncbi:MAG TPA: methionyl-tRNA formyltransferase [Terriglobales bacterium]|nr:methionyl-tRNA formyltransferase [Terriglobales bacterium]